MKIQLIFILLNNTTRRKKKEGNVISNDALNTFYLWLYGFRHMDHSDNKRRNLLPFCFLMGILKCKIY